MDWTLHGDLATCRGAWLALETDAIGTPFQRYGWLAAWQTAFGAARGVAPRILIGSDGGRPQILVPLALDRWLGARRLSWLGWRWSNYNAPLVARDAWSAFEQDGVDLLLEAVACLVPEADYLYLPKQPPLIDGRPNPLTDWCSTDEPNAAYMRTLGEDGPKAAGGTMGRRNKEKTRKLAQAGAIWIGEVVAPEDIRRQTGDLCAWKEQQLAASSLTNPFADPTARDFLTAAALAEQTPVRLFSLTLDGAPLASAYTLTGGNSLVVYQTGYAQGPHNAHSPGRILLYAVLDQATREGHERLDLSIGYEPYKASFCDCVETQKAGLGALRATGRPAVLAERGVAAAKRFAKARPDLFRRLRGARQHLAAPALRLSVSAPLLAEGASLI